MARRKAGRDARNDKDLIDTSPDAEWSTLVGGRGESAESHEPRRTATPIAAATELRGRGRTGLILLVSFVVQLIVVLAAGNTVVVRNALDFARDKSADGNSLLAALGRLPRVFAWRFTPSTADHAQLYAAQLIGLVAVFVVAAILTLALVRGPVTFWRAFVAVWLSVIVAVVIGEMVQRAIVLPPQTVSVNDKIATVLFDGNGYEVIAGVLTGLLAGLVAAIVAVASRRPAQLVVPVADPDDEGAVRDTEQPYEEPIAPPPWHGDDDRYASPAYASPAYAAAPPPAYGASREGVDDPAASAATTTFPAVTDHDRDRAPERVSAPEYGAERRSDRTVGPADDSRSDAQSTTQFERPARLPEDDAPQAHDTPPAREPETDSTQAMPAVPADDERSPQRPSEPAGREFPRPPDDGDLGDLGHHPDDD